MASPRTQLPYGFESNYPKIQKNPLYTFYVNPPKIHSITFKGGGTRVFVYRKFVEIAQQRGLLNDIKETGGSSSGSIAAIFTAIPFEQPHLRLEAFKNFNKADPLDVIGNTPGWVGKLLSRMTSPRGTPGSYSLVRGIAGFYNLVTRGGVYLCKVHESLRDTIQVNTENALNILLNKIPNQHEKRMILKHLHEIGIYEDHNEEKHVTQNLTFKHFSELAKLPGSQFKEIFMTGVRLKDKALVVFNNPNTPTCQSSCSPYCYYST